MEENELLEIMNTTFITFLLTKKCNLNCWYCDVGTKIDSHMVTHDEMDKVIQFINGTEKPNVVLHFFGGEPTIHPNLIAYIKQAKKNIHKNLDILLTTNLTQDIDHYPSYLNITASFHPNYISDWDEWFGRAYKLQEKGILNRVVLMVNAYNKDDIIQLNNKHRELPLVVVPIDQHIDDIDFAGMFENIEPEEEEIFFDKATPCACSSGLIILENGDVCYCWNRTHEPVFNVYETPDKILSPWHVCGKYSEKCDAEVVRCSLMYYNDVIKEMKYITRPNKKVHFRCNG